VIQAVVAAVRDGALAAAPGLPLSDTLKRVDAGRVRTTIDRDELVAAQTPQVFRRDALAAVLRQATTATDELTLVERSIERGDLAGDVDVVPGSVWGHKVTYAEDLSFLDAVVRGNAS